MLVKIIGDSGTRYLAMDSQMAGDLVSFAEPVTKWSTVVVDPTWLLRVLRKAVKIASTPPMGPVYVCLPMDVLDAPLVEEVFPATIPSTRVVPDEPLIREMAQMLAAAERPVIFVGDGVAYSGAQDELARVAELLGAEVFPILGSIFAPQAKVIHIDLNSNVPLQMSRFMDELMNQLPQDSINFDEALTNSPAISRYFAPARTGQHFLTRGGSLGVGIPGAIGAKLANPEKTVIGFTGDGGAIYTIQALWTAARHNINAKFVVCNNASYRLLQLNIDAYWKERANPRHDFPLSFDLSTPPLQFHEMVHSMNVQAARVEKPWVIAPAIRQALAHPGPFLIDLVLEGDTHPERVGATWANDNVLPGKRNFRQTIQEGLNNHACFKQWYDRVTDLFFDENHYVQSIDAKINSDEAVLDIVVGWQASWWEPPSAKSKRVSMDATQRWTVRRSSKNPYGLEIVAYNATVEPYKYTPSFARL